MKKGMWFLALSFTGVVLTDIAQAAPSRCEARMPSSHALKQLQQVMATGRFVAYEATSSQVINGKKTQSDPASIKQDLRALRPTFDGLITYGSRDGNERIADIAAKLHFRAVIIGIWGVNDEQEIAAALAAAKRQPQLVVGVSLGNERVYAKEITPLQLAQRINILRGRAPQLAITTTEPFHILLEASAQPITQASDFMLVNIHPVFESWFRNAPDANAAEFVTSVVGKLKPVACGPILVKETGVPTAPTDKGFTVERQASFYQALAKRFSPSATQAFAWFSAFDAPWRVNDISPVPGSHPEEAHWGLFDEHRTPKPVVQNIRPLKPPTATEQR